MRSICRKRRRRSSRFPDRGGHAAPVTWTVGAPVTWRGSSYGKRRTPNRARGGRPFRRLPRRRSDAALLGMADECGTRVLCSKRGNWLRPAGVKCTVLHMRRTVSIVDARRQLGRLAEQVRRTGQPIVLTRRGRAVARITPDVAPSADEPRDALGPLRGTVRLRGSFGDLQRSIRALRTEFAASLGRRAVLVSRGGRRRD
jgi:prevent-host-death family protein